MKKVHQIGGSILLMVISAIIEVLVIYTDIIGNKSLAGFVAGVLFAIGFFTLFSRIGVRNKV